MFIDVANVVYLLVVNTSHGILTVIFKHEVMHFLSDNITHCTVYRAHYIKRIKFVLNVEYC